MYFDHCRCPACKTAFDPEKVESRGGALTCPNCQAQLDLKSLFGVADHLEEEVDDNMTIDDLVPGYGPNAREPDAGYQAERQAKRQRGQPETRKTRMIADQDAKGGKPLSAADLFGKNKR